MPEFNVDRTEEDERRDRRRTNWPLWLLVPLGIFGLVAVTQLGDQRDETVFQTRPESTRIYFQGRTFSNVGASEVAYAADQMVQIGTTDNGIILFRHRSQPWAGGGSPYGKGPAAGGGGGPLTSITNPVYMKTGKDTYLPLQPIGKAPAGGMPRANNAGGVGAEPRQ